jgi:predicted ATPase
MSQRELARRAGYSADYVSMLERGVRSPGPATLGPLVEALELSEAERYDLQQTTWSTRPNGPTFEPPALTSASELVDRVAEREQIEAFLDGDEPALLVVGNAGFGKTRLLEHARRQAVARRMTTLAAGSNPNPTAPPRAYSPILEALSGFVHAQSPRRLRGMLQGSEWLARLLPELHDVGITVPRARLGAEQERRQVFHAVGRFLTRNAGPSGALLVLDDLQSASTEAFELIGHLLSGGPRVRLLGAYRPGEAGPTHPLGGLVEHLLHRDDLEQIRLRPLEPDASKQMLRALLPSSAADDDRVAEAARLSDGVPLYVVCFARALRAQLAIEQRGGSAVSNWMALGLPSGLVDIVRRQIGRLSNPSQEVLRAVARADATAVDRARLHMAVKLPEATMQSALEQLVRTGVLAEVRPNGFDVTHQVVRRIAASMSFTS